VLCELNHQFTGHEVPLLWKTCGLDEASLSGL